MKIARFDAPNHNVEQIKKILTNIGDGFESHDGINFMVAIEQTNKSDDLTGFLEAVGFKNVMVIEMIEVDPIFSNLQEHNTMILTKYVLVYRTYDDNKTFCYSTVNPTLKAKLNADYIFAPGVYPIPMKDTHGIFSNSHPKIPCDSKLMRLLGR